MSQGQIQNGKKNPPELMLSWTEKKLSGEEVLKILTEINAKLKCKAKFVDELEDGKDSTIVQFKKSKDLTDFQNSAKKMGTKLDSMLAGFKVQEELTQTQHNQISWSVSKNDDNSDTSEEQDGDVKMDEECKDNHKGKWKVGDLVEVDDGDGNGYKPWYITEITHNGNRLDLKSLTDEINQIDLTDDGTKIRKYSGQSALAKNKEVKKTETQNKGKSNNSTNVGSSDFPSLTNLNNSNKNSNGVATMNKQHQLQHNEHNEQNQGNGAIKANDGNKKNQIYEKNNKNDKNETMQNQNDDYYIDGLDDDSGKQDTNEEHSNNNNNNNNNSNYESFVARDPATDQCNSNIVCQKCKKPLTNQERTLQNGNCHSWCINVIDNRNKIVTNSNKMQNQYQNTQNIQNGENGENGHNSRNALWYEAFVGNTSQFKQESTGSCTINGLEAAIQLQLEKKPSIQLVDKIVEIASVYKADKHTGMEDVFPSISRYGESLEQVDYLQLLKSAGHVLFKTMQNWVDKHHHAISCVVTAPPESFFLHLDLIGGVTMFDSHPRGHLGLKNSHFLLFENSEKCLEYLKQELFRCVKLDVSDISAYQLQAMNAFEANLLMLKFAAVVNDTPDIEQLKRELRRVDDRLNKEYEFESRKHGNDYRDLLKYNERKNSNSKSHDNKYDNRHDSSNENWRAKEIEYQNRINALESQLNSIMNGSGDTDTARKTIGQYARQVQTLEDRNQVLTQQCEKMQQDLTQLRKRANASSNKDDEKFNFSANYPQTHEKLQSQFYCFLCNDYKNEGEKVLLSNCKCDNLCRDCLINYIRASINEKKIQIRCPKCHDSKNITDDDISKLSYTLFKKYQALVNEHFNKETLTQPNWGEMECQNDKCNYSGSSDSWIECKRIYLVCPRCQSCSFCKDCGLSEMYHRGLVPCKIALARANNPARFMQCGNCNGWIENESVNGKGYKPLRQCNHCRKNVCFKCGLTQSDKINSSWHFGTMNLAGGCNSKRFSKK